MPTEGRRTRTLIAGLGNLLLRDDGVGIHAVRRLRKTALPLHVLTAGVGTAVLDALHLFEWADRIVAIDAMQAGGLPGTIYRFGIGDIDAGGTRASMHELGFLGAVRMLRRPPPQVTVFGVEPGAIDYGLELSPSVEAALPGLMVAVRNAVI
jgi:hydrogenase maturation protease